MNVVEGVVDNPLNQLRGRAWGEIGVDHTVEAGVAKSGRRDGDQPRIGTTEFVIISLCRLFTADNVDSLNLRRDFQGIIEQDATEPLQPRKGLDRFSVALEMNHEREHAGRGTGRGLRGCNRTHKWSSETMVVPQATISGLRRRLEKPIRA